MKGHKSTVWSFDFDSSEQFMVSVSEDRELLIWMIQDKSYECCGRIVTPHTRSIYSVSWSKAGNYIATGGGDNKIYVYEINWDSLFSKEGEFEYDIIAESSPENGH